MLLLSIGIEIHPDLVLVLPLHLVWRSTNRPLVDVVVGVDNLREDVEVVACPVGSEVAPEACHECPIEALPHGRILIPVRYEMVQPFPLQKSWHGLVQKFLARVCLESSRFPGVCIFEEMLEGGEHLLPRIDLDRDRPCPLG